MARIDHNEAFLKMLGERYPDAVRLSLEETQKFRQRWRDRFVGKNPHAAGIKIPLHGCHMCGIRPCTYDWHFFSFNHTPADRGFKEKLGAYSEPEENIVVFAEPCEAPALQLKYRDLEKFFMGNAVGNNDIYMSPRKLGWTLVFTHEEDFGPYFMVAARK
jgi:hypothetical protein